MCPEKPAQESGIHRTLKASGFVLIALLLMAALALPADTIKAQGTQEPSAEATTEPTGEPTAAATSEPATEATSEPTAEAAVTRYPPCPGGVYPTLTASPSATPNTGSTSEATAAATAESTADATAFAPGFLGIAATTVAERCGAQVIEITPDSPAERGGLQLNDIIVAVNGNLTPERDILREYVLRSAPGAEVELVVKRGDAEVVLTVVLGSRPEETPATAEPTARP